MSALQVYLLMVAIAAVASRTGGLETTMRPPPPRRFEREESILYDSLTLEMEETESLPYKGRVRQGMRRARNARQPLPVSNVEHGPRQTTDMPRRTTHRPRRTTHMPQQTTENYNTYEGRLESTTSRPCRQVDSHSVRLETRGNISLEPEEVEGGQRSARNFIDGEVVFADFPSYLAHETATEKIYLAWPVIKYCHERVPYTYTLNRKGYYLNSWELPEYRITDPITGEVTSKTFTWVEARNECRKRCMDTISFETQVELDTYSGLLAASKLPSIWTSGRTCDYLECADREELKPLKVNGWSWMGSKVKISPTNALPPNWSFQPWSPTGISTSPQPDNAEFAINGKNESCLALMNNAFNDRIKFHDVACYHKKHFTCEDSPELIDMAFQELGIVIAVP